MPNWCTNELEVQGPIREIERFYYLNLASDENGRSEPLLLNTLVSIPEGRRELAKELWGTSSEIKAAVDITLWEESIKNNEANSLLFYNFKTTWGPPITWLEKIQELFPLLFFTLSYIEPGTNFAGDAVTIDGQIIDRRRDATIIDLHNFGSHMPVPELACNACMGEDFTAFHEAGHPNVAPDQILNHCTICRHIQGLEHPADACHLCEQR